MLISSSSTGMRMPYMHAMMRTNKIQHFGSLLSNLLKQHKRGK